MTPRIAPAVPADATAMATILQAWVAETPWMPRLHSDAATAALCDRLVPETLVALRGGAVQGFLTRRGHEIVMLYLASAHRGMGLGRLLVDAAKADAPRLGVWSFAANTRALAFYRREGFAQTGGTSGDNDEGLPDIRLEWSRP